MRQRFVRRHLHPTPVHAPYAPPRLVLASPLHVERHRTADGHTILRPVGELESATVPVFRQAVAEIGPQQRVIVDMADVPFLDSCGIGALIGAARRVRELDGDITIAAVCQPVQRVLSLTGIDRVVHLSATVEEAGAFLDGIERESSTPGDPTAIWAAYG